MMSENNSEKKNRNARRAVILLVWLLLWQLASVMIHNKIIFVGPWEAACALFSQAMTMEFWRTILSSFLRIAGGFLLAFFVGIFTAFLAGKYRLLREFLEPPVALLQSVPVASFVILALIWIGSENLSVLITFVVVFPVIYRNVLEGLSQTDQKMLEMAYIFEMKPWKKIWYIYRPALMPYLLAGSRIALGMAWKSGVAAEVIGVPDCSIGEKLYMAKIYLSTADLFAWTFVIIVVSKVFEWLFLSLLQAAAKAAKIKPDYWMQKRQESDKTTGELHAAQFLSGKNSGENVHGVTSNSPGSRPKPIRVEKIQKSYHNSPVLTGTSLCLEPGGRYCLMGPSGQGKTTLLRILMGLERPDEGRILGMEGQKISAVFQEDRLCKYLDSVDNCRIAGGKVGLWLDPERLCRELLESRMYERKQKVTHEAQQEWEEAMDCTIPKKVKDWLKDDTVRRPVSELSGGMKRRAAIARALSVSSDVIFMDEPFTGLDPETKKRVIRIIRENLQGRTLLVVTHQKEDAALLEGEILYL